MPIIFAYFFFLDCLIYHAFSLLDDDFRHVMAAADNAATPPLTPAYGHHAIFLSFHYFSATALIFFFFFFCCFATLRPLRWSLYLIDAFDTIYFSLPPFSLFLHYFLLHFLLLRLDYLFRRLYFSSSLYRFHYFAFFFLPLRHATPRFAIALIRQRHAAAIIDAYFDYFDNNRTQISLIFSPADYRSLSFFRRHASRRYAADAMP